MSIDLGAGIDIIPDLVTIGGLSMLRVNTTERNFIEIAGQEVNLTASLFALRVGLFKVDFGGYIVGSGRS